MIKKEIIRIQAVKKETIQLPHKKGQRAFKMIQEIDESTQRPYKNLKQWRNRIARSKNLARYHILQNVALSDIACKRPCTEDDLLSVHQFGEKKLEQYGNDIIEIVQKHIESEKGSDNKGVV